MLRPVRIPAVVMFSVFALLGCTNRGIYEGVQTGNRLACQEQPPSQYDECMERNSVSYDEYERTRAEAGEE